MTWSDQQDFSEEASKIRWELVPYTGGRGLDLGCGPMKAYPHFIGVDINVDFARTAHALRPEFTADCERLEMFADASMDFVFSSFLLQTIEDYRATLKDWWRMIKPGGHLCLYLPHKDLHVNEDYKHDFAPSDITNAMRAIGSWDLVENQVREDGDEYAFFQVYKKISGTKQHYSCRAQKPAKTCAVIRYGAFGDAIQTASIFPGLKRQGYHLTLYTARGAHDVLREDPNVDRFVVQAENQVPNVWLGEYWHYLSKKYDHFINLSESIEGALLALPGRANHGWPHAVRHKYLNRNYLEWTHELAGVPFKPGEGAVFYPTEYERLWAKSERKKMGPFVVLWSLAGSAGHKAWPHMDSIIARLMIETDAQVVLCGGPECVLLEAGWESEPRVHRTSGKWSIRQSMAFCSMADVVIGTETGLLNVAAYLSVPKIITLSHSSVENLTRDWVNTTALMPDTREVPCFPCHQMHYDFKYCPRDIEPDCEACKTVTCEAHTGTAMCQAKITAPMMWEAIEPLLRRQRMRA